jgi:hypothetical protein
MGTKVTLQTLCLGLFTFIFLFTSGLWAQVDWTHVSEQPVIGTGSEGTWDGSSAFLPAVIKDGDTLKMWYTGVNGSVLSPNKGIGYAWSVDGIEWHRHQLNPLLMGFALFDVSSGPVIMENDTLKMWYSEGMDVRYATSLDGVNWKPVTGVVLQPGPVGDWDSGQFPWGPCSVIKEDGLYKMWFKGTLGVFPNTNVQIGLATSTDGIHWEKYDDPSTTEPPYAISDPVLTVGSEGEWDALHIKSCSVLPTESGYEMWYDGLPFLSPQQWLGYATSEDGISWTKWPENPIIGSCPGWGNWGYLLGTVLNFDNQYHMWYASFDAGGDFPQIGYATAPFGGPASSIILVDINGSGDFTSIQKGINASTTGDTVLVMQGMYIENIDFLGKSICVMSQDGPEFTIVDGSQPTNSEFGSVVTFGSGEDSTSVLSGFTLTGGIGFWINDRGGIRIGGGILCQNASPTIEQNIIKENHANDGGGIEIAQNSSAIVRRNIIWKNEASTTGPGFRPNGGGIDVVFGANPLIINNTIVQNNCIGGGGDGIGAIFDAAPIIVNNIISDNGSYGGASGINSLDGGDPLLLYSNIWINTYSGVSCIEGCMELDPMFVDPENGDFRLQPGSPCIDMGDPNGPLDPDGTRADLGALPTYNPSGPYVWSTTHTIDDSEGNKNNRANAGETVNVIVSLKNTGLTAENVVATLDSKDPSIQVVNNTAAYGNINKDEIALNRENPFSISVNVSTNTHPCLFNLDVTSDGGFSSSDSFYVLVGTSSFLLVDDDEGEIYEIIYQRCLNKLEEYPETCDINIAGGLTEDLDNYETVLWFTGNKRENTLTEEDQLSIINFLNNGGDLLITGQDIAYDLSTSGSKADSLFLADYLHVDFIADSANTFRLLGIRNDPISSGLNVFLSGDYFSAQNQTAPDILSPIPPAEKIFKYLPGNGCAAIRYENTQSGSKVVYLGFGFEGVAGPQEDTAYRLMQNILNWFALPTDVSQIHHSTNLPMQFGLEQNYPNPFNPETTILFSLDNNGLVKLVIYDVLGRKVKTLADSKYPTGEYSILWDGRDEDQNQMPSGVYFIKLETGNSSQIRKMLLVR